MSEFDDVKGEDGLNEEDAVGLVVEDEVDLTDDVDVIDPLAEIDPLADPVDDGEPDDKKEIEDIILQEIYGEDDQF